MNANCPNCKGEGWVCENYPHRPWGGVEGGCTCGGDGVACVCNPEESYKQPISASEETVGARRTDDDSEHKMACPECGEEFDRRDLDAVFFHGFGHEHRPDIPYSGGVRVT
jgi:hypothetical protein